MNYIKTNHAASGEPVQLFYQDLGRGRPVVLLHGWPLSHEMWEYQLDALVNSGLRCILYDRRGFGKSSRPWNGYDYDTLTDDLKAVMDALDLQDVTLVGFSMGGGEVARYFGRYGGARVSRAVLISAVTPGLWKTDANPEGAMDQESLDGMLARMREDRIGFLDSFGKTFFGINLIKHPVSTPLLEYYRMLASLASSRATQECTVAFSKTDFSGDMGKINVPTLLIHGDADKIVPLETSSRRSMQMVPDNKLIVYEDAPHGLFYTHKELLNRDLLDFIL